jgi:protoporphyrin/coproporphyrin ferrochelatase
MSSSGTGPIGVLWLDIGGPERAQDVPAFLRSFLSDPRVVPVPWPIRPLLARFIATRRSAQAAAHYRAIGGGSPLPQQSRWQTEALQEELGEPFVVRYAFRHSAPHIPDVIAGLHCQGVRRVIALPAFPQQSHTTTTSALEACAAAARREGCDMAAIRSYANAPGFVKAIADLAFPMLGAGSFVLFCAHGLPEKIVRAGDPYVADVHSTVAAVAARLPRKVRYGFAYQSRLGTQRWTRPYLTEEIARLGRDGISSLVLIPVSFVCENLETLYELDVEIAELAAKSGIPSLRRVPTPACHPTLVSELARLVRTKIQELDWQ